MPSGYFCLMKGRRVVKYAYLQSGVDLSGYGYEILSAIFKDTILQWVDKQIAYNQKLYGIKAPSPNFSLTWIKKTAANKSWENSDFYKYSYEYNINTGVLRVYSYGDLFLTIYKKDYEKYLFFFEHASNLIPYFQYDSDLMEYNYKTNIQNVIRKSSLEELEHILPLSKKERLELEDGHSTLSGHHIGSSDYLSSYIYSKKLRTSNYQEIGTRGFRKSVPFIVEKPYRNNTWNILVQLPYIQIPIASSFKSEKKAVAYLRDLIRRVPLSELFRFVEICDTLEYMYIHQNHHYEEMKLFLSSLEESFQNEPWYTPADHFTVKEIRQIYSLFT